MKSTAFAYLIAAALLLPPCALAEEAKGVTVVTMADQQEAESETYDLYVTATYRFDGPFAIINADDYYGVEAFKTIYDYLTANPDNAECYEYVMVGYLLKNTVTENGTVARGVCEATADGYLANVTERTKIDKGEKCPRYTEDDGATWTELDSDTIVSMNMWGFHKSYLEEAWARFPAFLDNAVKTNPLKGEYFLPAVVSQLLDEGKARVRVLSSHDKWYGVTYKEDKPVVVNALAGMRENGLYPEKLWK